MIRIAVLDDEENYFEVIRQITQKTMEEMGMEYEIQEYSCADTLFADLSKDEYFDVYLLDIQLPDKSGMEVAKQIRLKFWDPIIIFITNYLDYAIQAFEVNAFRYIPKNLLNEYLPKAYQMLSTDKWQARQRVYVVTTNSRVEKIPYREIYYLKKEGKYVLIVHQRGTSKVRKTLQDVVDELNANHFRIIERGFAVNMYHVMSFKDHQILVRDGSYLPVGKQRIQMVRKAIMEMGEDRWC